MNDYTPEAPQTKQCRVCSNVFPATTEFFHKHQNKIDGLRSDCKKCNNAKGRQWTKNNTQRVSERNRIYREKNKDSILDKQRKWNADNQERRKEYNLRYREEKGEQLREYDRQRSSSPERKKWRSEYRKRRPDVFARIAKRDFERHREKYRVWNHKHEARKRELSTDFTPADWQAALDYFGGRCAVCGRPPGLFHAIAMDHWIPLNAPDCPGTVPSNIVPLCHGTDGCNNSKHDASADVWLKEKFGKRKGVKILSKIQAFLSSTEKE